VKNKLAGNVFLSRIPTWGEEWSGKDGFIFFQAKVPSPGRML
jgi:hypothetical protein